MWHVKNYDILYSHSAQDTNWYHLGGQMCVMFFGYIYVSKLEKKHDGLLWGCSYTFLEAY